MTAKQTELLAADDIDGFDSSLDSRQEFIEKIKGLHQETDILMQSYTSIHGTAAGGSNGAVEQAAARRREMIAKCAALNERNTVTAKEKAEGYIKRIGKLSLSRKSIELYAPGLPNKPGLIDRKT